MQHTQPCCTASMHVGRITVPHGKLSGMALPEGPPARCSASKLFVPGCQCLGYSMMIRQPVPGRGTRYGRAQQLEEVVPEVELVASDQEARPEEQRPPQAQENLVRQRVLGRRAPLQTHCLRQATRLIIAPCMCRLASVHEHTLRMSHMHRVDLQRQSQSSMSHTFTTE